MVTWNSNMFSFLNLLSKTYAKIQRAVFPFGKLFPLNINHGKHTYNVELLVKSLIYNFIFTQVIGH